MNTRSRFFALFGAGLLAVVLSSCAGGGANVDPQAPASEGKDEQQDGLADVDLCSLLKPDSLDAVGLEGPGEPGNVASQPTCEFEGQDIMMALYKNPKKPVADSAKQDDWARFDRIDVSGRPGAEAVSAGSTNAGICSVLFDSGGGSLQVQVTAVEMGKVDECAEAAKIAKLIEPAAPK